ncbi:TIM barrel protein [candidate division KSB1 bacterium]|nr:TIM barrel protein [candidate division KSB1 bacterium]
MKTVPISATAAVLSSGPLFALSDVKRRKKSHIKYSLNAYSFNNPLRAGAMTLFDVVDFCASLDFDGLDATGYYFPGYPDVPKDAYIYALKRRAFASGITIHGTGVRNDFTITDKKQRREDIELVKNWINVASKLGATVIRVFPGSDVPVGYTFDEVLEWMIPDMMSCVDYGKNHGVITAMQNHNHFIKTADEAIKIVEAVNSDWFGVVLDIGSLRRGDPYEEISRLAPYAVSWQLKEMVWYGDKQVPVDVQKIKAIIDSSGYRGFLPIETLGSGDPKAKIKNLISKVREYI